MHKRRVGMILPAVASVASCSERHSPNPSQRPPRQDHWPLPRRSHPIPPHRHASLGGRKRLAGLSVLLVALALAAPSAATAQGKGPDSGPTSAQYEPTNGLFAAGGSGHGGGGSDPSTSGHVVGLPFTGLDIGVLVACAGALLGAGVVLRRLSDARRSAD